MAGIDDVLERLVSDAGFARQLAQDPAVALAGYELNEDDLTLLSTQVSFDQGALSTVEERVSKAGMFGLLSSFTAGLGSLGGPDTMPAGLGGPDTAPTGLGGPDTSPGGERGIVIDWTPGEDAAQSGGGGGGDEVAIKEVDPAPAPSLDNPGALHGFDPQPDPPGDPADGLQSGEAPGGGGDEVAIKEVDPAPAPSLDDPGALHGFDPQPDPPGEPASGPGGLVDPGDAVGFNPQPDPPGEPASGPGGLVDPGDAVGIKEVDPAPAPSLDNPGVARGFNPQPDPPGAPVGGLHPGEESGIIVYD